ncbi:hypothetical protein ABID82_005002 [Methylobacterium sp. PvP062]|uniref:Uncharacterized protein n=1 Tax=Methylobacterium radiotolerans TaxID=31998 RepID=A0ABV2NP17_9HYPH|nr:MULTISPECIES: hypothetical protein [unclassified Methylobacterium]MBP2495013.1 hypothetical protein [Methylobacterium sp. PvP105]MBP2505116.1 hypothetical protein [Methylobacterium sp. PvP109]MCX7331352.1 hypothetical protein [Hyphomicrobiales bacterium]
MPEISELLARPAPERFDGAEAWSKLGEDARAQVGIAALEMVCALRLAERADSEDLPELYERVGFTACNEMEAALSHAVDEVLPDDALDASDDRPRIPASLGGVCRCCGCSQNDACEEGCSWAADDLCTAGVDGGGHDHG